MKIFLKVVAALVGMPLIAIALFGIWASAGTYEKQNYAAIFDFDASPDPKTATPKESYTIATYNIGYLSGLENNKTTQLDQAFFENNQQQAIDALISVKPDIIGFQEIDIEAKRSYGVNQVEAVANGLGMGVGAIAINWDKRYLPFPYWPPSGHFGKIISGQAITSRYPIIKNNRIVLERVPKSFIYNAFYLDRLAQVSEIQLGEKALIVINVHLEAFAEETRINQTKFVRQIAEDYAKTQPVIVMGDLNSALNRNTIVTAQGEILAERQFSIKEMLASEQLASAVPQESWNEENATFPTDQPEYKLDYLFYTPSSIEILDTQVLSAAAQASDHLPLVAQFRFK
ncbi:MAG: endonuclease/exonuclease/phosphatase family protein [Cyanobacteria bacterium P01_F01_bin.53]